jgi:hypothetical protein
VVPHKLAPAAAPNAPDDEQKVPLLPRPPTNATYRLEWASLIKRIYAKQKLA